MIKVSRMGEPEFIIEGLTLDDIDFLYTVIDFLYTVLDSQTNEGINMLDGLYETLKSELLNAGRLSNGFTSDKYRFYVKPRPSLLVCQK